MFLKMVRRIVITYLVYMYLKCSSLTGPNIALGKPTVQFLSTFLGGSASKAVDGNTSDHNVGDMCAHTERGTQTNPAWWRVDLEAKYNITGIKIYNRNQTGKQKMYTIA